MRTKKNTVSQKDWIGGKCSVGNIDGTRVQLAQCLVTRTRVKLSANSESYQHSHFYHPWHALKRNWDLNSAFSA